MRAKRLALLLVVLAACKGANPTPSGPPLSIRFAEGTALDAGGNAIVDFGTVAVGRQVRRVVVIESLADEPIDLELDAPGPPFFVVDAPERIAAGSHTSLVFRLAPEGEGEFEQTISLGAGGRKLGIRLVGRAEGVEIGCEARVEPEALWLGAGPEGIDLPWNRPLVVEVLKGRCTLEEVRAEGELEFSLDDLPGKVLLEGNRYRAALHVAPAPAGTTGSLVLDFGETELRIPVEILEAPRCVSLENDELEFLEGYRCERTITVPLKKDCWGPVELLSARLVPEEAERWFSVQSGPQGIAVTYWADDLVETARAVVVLDYDNGDRLHLTLEGRVNVAEQPIVVPSISVDVLFMVDKTAAAEALEEAVDEVATRMARWMVTTDVDARLGVTTTLFHEQEGCEAEAGRLLPLDGSRPPVLTRHTPDLEAVLRANLTVERCAPPGSSRGFEAAIAAFGPGEEGWTRPDAKRVVVAVVAEDDGSPAHLRTTYLTRLWDVGVSHFYVVGPDPSCGEQWLTPSSYAWMSNSLEGFHEPFCVPAPGESIPFELDGIGPPFHEIELDVRADTAGAYADEYDGILLLYDGVPIPSVGTPTTPGWLVAEHGWVLRLNRGFPAGIGFLLRYPPHGTACKQ